MTSKPHYKFSVVAGRPVSIEKKESPQVAEARKRFGKLFAHEKGSTWRPRETPLLLDWLTRKGK